MRLPGLCSKVSFWASLSCQSSHEDDPADQVDLTQQSKTNCNQSQRQVLSADYMQHAGNIEESIERCPDSYQVDSLALFSTTLECHASKILCRLKASLAACGGSCRLQPCLPQLLDAAWLSHVMPSQAASRSCGRQGSTWHYM